MRYLEAQIAMNRLVILAALALCVSLVAHATVQNTPVIPFPSDPTAIVISMDYREGFGGGCIDPSKRVPFLSIHADGRMTTRGGPCGPIFEGRVPLVVVQALLQFIIEEVKLTTFTKDGAWEEIKNERRKRNATTVSNVYDAGQVVVHVQTATIEHEAAFEGLSFYLAENPGAHSLVQLSAVVYRLNQLVDETNPRFLETFASSISQANEYLNRNRRDLPGVSERYRIRTLSLDGNRWINEFAYNLVGGSSVLVSVATDGIDNPVVSVAVRPR
jgi:hypothetical protein